MKRAIVLIAVKQFAVAIMIAGVLALGQSAARADELTLIGGTTGILNTPPTLLTYNSARIDGATNNGLFVLEATATPPRNINNLGSFTLFATPLEAFEGAFTLSVQIDFPGGILGGNTRLFAGSLFFDPQSDNLLLIDMPDTPQLYAFSDSFGSGVFSLTVDDLLFFFGSSGSQSQAAAAALLRTVNCPSFPCTSALTGTITVVSFTPIPEPATLFLLATGMAGVAAIVRRRLNKDEG